MSDAQRPTTFRVPQTPGEVVRRYWLRLIVVLVALGIGVQMFRTSFYDQGYAPEQPIAFPHDKHAGDLGIDCKYCHFNAARGKHAGVPPMSICLGCHGSQGGQVAATKPGIVTLNRIADQGGYVSDAEGKILDLKPDDKLPADAIVHEGGVVHWNRVHKLPDFVYFPHKWHIAAGVACQTCHGPIETMAVVRQYADLTMGWCLECHRRGNYVGGREYQHDRPETFTVGTPNYEVTRARIAYDDVVKFLERDTKAHPRGEHAEGAEAHAEHGDAHVAEAHPSDQYTTKMLPSSGGRPPEYQKAMDAVVAGHPALRDAPAWRIADLPETHRLIYADLIAQDRAAYVAANGKEPGEAEEREFLLRRAFMNSPTQCSTCHQ